MGILSDFFEWLAPDQPEEVRPKPQGSEFQFQRPDKCQFLYGEFTREEPLIVRSEIKTVTVGASQAVPNNVMVMQVIWSQGAIDSIENVYLDDMDINSDSFGYDEVTTTTGINFGGKVAKCEHVLDGGQKTVQLEQFQFDFDGFGNAYSIITLVYDQSLMPQKPKVTASGFGKLIKNLQTGLVEYSADAIDVYYDYCTNFYGAKIPEDKFTISQLLEERAFTSQGVVNADGETQAMMSFNGVVDGNKKAIDNINAMRKQMRAYMPLVDGKYHVLIERERTPENYTINRDNRMSKMTVENINSGDLISQVIVKFKDRAQRGKEVKIEYPESASNENTITVTLGGVNNAYEAKQYASVVYNRASNSRTATVSTDRTGKLFNVGQVIKVDEPRLGMNGKNWLITAKQDSNDIVKFSLLEYVESIYPWVAHPIPTVPVSNIPNNRIVNKPTNLTYTDVEGDAVISWESDYSTFEIQQVINGVMTDIGERGHKFVNLGNLPQGEQSIMLRAINGLGYPSEWQEFTFSIQLPSSVINLTVTDAYIEWQHQALANIKEFIIETTELSQNNAVAHSQPPSSNGTQRLEISGIKSGDYDVSVIAVGLNGLKSLPTTLTNAQIDGVTGAVNDAVNTAVTGFTADPHTWTKNNNFTGGLQKNGVDVLARGDYGVGIGGESTDVRWSQIYSIGSAFNGSGLDAPSSGFHYGISAKSSDDANGIQIAGRDKIFFKLGSSSNPWYEFIDAETSQTITGQKNFTGGLLKNNTDVLSLGDLTPGSSASLVLAESSIEQFTLNQQAGLYDDFSVAEGAIAAGWINAVSAQMNYLISQGANIEKIKSSAIEVSGAGYALNQNPTWQDSLDGWSLSSGLNGFTSSSANLSVVVTKDFLSLNTTGNNKAIFNTPTPITKQDTYTVSVWLYQVGSATQFLALNFMDKNGVSIGSSGGATGWPSIGSYHYYGLVNQSSTGDWERYEIKIGKNGDATIPDGATQVRLGALINYSGDYANTAVYLQDYRIEKAMGSVHIENGSINADHLVLSGNGSITFATVGADQAGSASTAETNAKAYAFPASSAGALASRNTVGPTHIDNNSITTDKILASQALIDKIVSNYVFGINAKFEGEVYAKNITGDANEIGTVSLPTKSTGATSFTLLLEVNLGNDEFLDREVSIQPFMLEGDAELRWATHSTSTGGSASHPSTGSGFFYATPSSKGSNSKMTDLVKIVVPKNTTTFLSIAFRLIPIAVSGTVSTSSSDEFTITTRAITNSLGPNITTY